MGRQTGGITRDFRFGFLKQRPYTPALPGTSRYSRRRMTGALSDGVAVAVAGAGTTKKEAIPLAVGRPDGVLCELLRQREVAWDRGASVLGSWDWMGIGSSESSGKRTAPVADCASRSTGAGSAGMPVAGVASARGGVRDAKERTWR